MANLLPATGGELHGIGVSNVTLVVPGERDKIGRTESGPTDLMDIRLAYWRGQATIGSNILSLNYQEGSGRATLTIEFASEINDPLQNEKYGIQELRSFDIVKDIALHPYFKSLTNQQIGIVIKSHEEVGSSNMTPKAAINWGPIENMLYNHLLRGITSYIDTAYELTVTHQYSSLMKAHKSAKNANKVVDLPSLSPTLENLIDELPDGEWLQKPIEVMYCGRNGWTVRVTYVWADQWSVIYGGTLLA